MLCHNLCEARKCHRWSRVELGPPAASPAHQSRPRRRSPRVEMARMMYAAALPHPTVIIMPANVSCDGNMDCLYQTCRSLLSDTRASLMHTKVFCALVGDLTNMLAPAMYWALPEHDLRLASMRPAHPLALCACFRSSHLQAISREATRIRWQAHPAAACSSAPHREALTAIAQGWPL